MLFRFRRTFSLLPGVRANITKTGASLSVGPRGAKLTAGSSGTRATAGVPGTGMFFSQQISQIHREEPKEPQLSLPPEVEEIVRERPPYWEFLLVQRALRSAFDDINTMAATVSSYGTDAITFHEWILEIIQEFQALVAEMEAVEAKMKEALGPVFAGKAGDPDRLVSAVDEFISLIRTVIVYEQRVAALIRHPLYGGLAQPLRDVAQPFVDGFTDLLQRLDDQLPKLDTTHRLDLQLTLKSSLSLPSLDAAQDAYGQRFFDDDYRLKSGDVVSERFRVARGENELGTFPQSCNCR